MIKGLGSVQRLVIDKLLKNKDAYILLVVDNSPYINDHCCIIDKNDNEYDSISRNTLTRLLKRNLLIAHTHTRPSTQIKRIYYKLNMETVAYTIAPKKPKTPAHRPLKHEKFYVYDFKKRPVGEFNRTEICDFLNIIYESLKPYLNTTKRAKGLYYVRTTKWS